MKDFWCFSWFTRGPLSVTNLYLRPNTLGLVLTDLWSILCLIDVDHPSCIVGHFVQPYYKKPLPWNLEKLPLRKHSAFILFNQHPSFMRPKLKYKTALTNQDQQACLAASCCWRDKYENCSRTWGTATWRELANKVIQIQTVICSTANISPFIPCWRFCWMLRHHEAHCREVMHIPAEVKGHIRIVGM